MQRHKFPIFRWAAISLMLITIVLTTIQLVSYSRLRNNFPLGMQVGRVPIGGLDYARAVERLYTVYRSPIEVTYGSSTLHLRPAVLGFEPEVEKMLAVADNQRVTEPYWQGFWNFLWSREINTINIPLNALYDDTRIQDYLRVEVSQRYDTPSSPPKPVPGSTEFNPGSPGTQLDLDRATLQIIDALQSPTNRRVNLALEQSSIPNPTLTDLEVMLKQIIEVSEFDGIVEIYLQELGTNRTLHLTYQIDNEDLRPNIAFSSWSLVKIPLMVTAFRYMDEPYPQRYLDLMAEMIEQSENTSTDDLAMAVIDSTLSPLIVTEDLQRLGLENTFWAGHFYPGAPLLQRFETPANQREDVETDPDEYNQTTPADMGMLLEDLYYCAESGGGSLIAAFPDELSQEKCTLMIDYLLSNKIGVLLQAGIPSGIPMAHKHGWAPDFDNILRTVGNSGIIYSPRADYVLSVFVYHPVQAVFDPVNLLFAQISQAVYNFYNN